LAAIETGACALDLTGRLTTSIQTALIGSKPLPAIEPGRGVERLLGFPHREVVSSDLGHKKYKENINFEFEPCAIEFAKQ
jgi:hypothetical protein